MGKSDDDVAAALKAALADASVDLSDHRLSKRMDEAMAEAIASIRGGKVKASKTVSPGDHEPAGKGQDAPPTKTKNSLSTRRAETRDHPGNNHQRPPPPHCPTGRASGAKAAATSS